MQRHAVNETQGNRCSGAGRILAVVREEGSKSGGGKRRETAGTSKLQRSGGN